MADTVLGTLTIGQAPRPDVTPILDRYVPTSVKRIHRGLLDGLSRDEIADAYAAKAGEAVLVTRLSDGSSVQIERPKGPFRPAGQTRCTRGGRLQQHRTAAVHRHIRG